MNTQRNFIYKIALLDSPLPPATAIIPRQAVKSGMYLSTSENKEFYTARMGNEYNLM
jgi:hypothetical protein